MESIKGLKENITLVLEYMVMSGEGIMTEADETFIMSPFLRLAIWSKTSRVIRTTETILQLTSFWENSLTLGS